MPGMAMAAVEGAESFMVSLFNRRTCLCLSGCFPAVEDTRTQAPPGESATENENRIAASAGRARIYTNSELEGFAPLGLFVPCRSSELGAIAKDYHAQSQQ
jgi:hypothetical protein